MNSSSVALITQARMGSSRLPEKVLKPILARSMLSLFLERVLRASEIKRVIVTTPESSVNDRIETEAINAGASVFRGPENDVLARYWLAAQQFNCDVIVRVTSDCPFADPDLIDEMIKYFLKNPDCDYLSNNRILNYPHGMDIEIFSFEALNRAHQECQTQENREHVTQYIYQNLERFKVENFKNSDADPQIGQYRWTVDFQEDFDFVKAVFEKIYPNKPNFGWKDVLRLVEKDPSLKKMNEIHARHRNSPA